MKGLLTGNVGRPSGGPPALVLAAVLCLAMTRPAFSDFDSAVAAYERGAYKQAQSQFEALAAGGDDRADLYLEKIRHKLKRVRDAGVSLASSLGESAASTSRGPNSSNREPETWGAASDTRPFPWGHSKRTALGGASVGQEPSSPSGRTTKPVGSATAPMAKVFAPRHTSFWSRIFHMPSDATVIGLQYVAGFVEAENLKSELRSISRHGDGISLGVLAGIWWVVLVRGMVGIGIGIGRFMTAATTREPKHHG